MPADYVCVDRCYSCGGLAVERFVSLDGEPMSYFRCEGCGLSTGPGDAGYRADLLGAAYGFLMAVAPDGVLREGRIRYGGQDE